MKIKDEIDDKYIKAKLEHQGISRRGLFRGLLSGAKKAADTNKPLVPRTVARPPGAQEEGVFQHLCDGCGKCEQACPQQVIRMENNLPALDLDYNHCDLCAECITACPTQALLPFPTGQKAKTELRPRFRKSCNNKLSGYCDLCEDECPEQAISIEAGQLPVLKPDLCTGCGQCKGQCPASAIELVLQS